MSARTHVDGASISEGFNQIKSMSTQDLQIFLNALGKDTGHLKEAVDKQIAANLDSDSLATRVTASSITSQIDTFFKSLDE